MMIQDRRSNFKVLSSHYIFFTFFFLLSKCSLEALEQKQGIRMQALLNLSFQEIDVAVSDQPFATYIKGLKLYIGHLVPVNVPEGYKLMLEAAEKGNLSAMKGLTKSSPHGQGHPVEPDCKFFWLARLAQSGDSSALLELLELTLWVSNEYLHNKYPEIKKFSERSDVKERFLKIVAAQDTHAEYILAVLMMSGKIFPKNEKEGLRLLKRAAAKNHIPALAELGACYLYGNHVSVNEHEGVTLLKMAAGSGNVQAAYNLATFLLNKSSLYFDLQEAKKWLYLAADRGFDIACLSLGNVLLQGSDDNHPTEEDFKEAFTYFEKAFKLGAKGSGYYLATMYMQGLGCEKNLKKSEEFYQAVIDAPSNYCEVVLSKAIMYEQGVFVDKNLETAKELYRTIEGIIPLARHNLARILNDELASMGKPSKKKKKYTVLTPRANNSQDLSENFIESFEADLDIAGEALKIALNSAITYEDKSFITQIDSTTGDITIENPRDGSTLVISLGALKKISYKNLKELKKFTYDSKKSARRTNVHEWFNDKEVLKKHTGEDALRHTFAQRVDEVIQLYGVRGYYPGENSMMILNTAVPGVLKDKNQKEYSGFFEYAFYEDHQKGKVLYHRFLHPHSKAFA